MIVLSVDDVLARLTRLPTPSLMITELLGEFESENVDIDKVVEKMSKDPALAATTLRLANSSHYGMAGRIGSLFHAALVLGTRTLNVIVVATRVSRQFSKPGGLSNWTIYWEHSFATALCARGLAIQVAEDSEIAFAAGLLHDIGILVLGTLCATEYDRVIAYKARSQITLLEAERLVLGLDHAAVGAGLLKRWNLPVAMQEAIANHHASDFTTGLADLIYTANVLTQHPISSDANAIELYNTPAWSRLGLNVGQCRSGTEDAIAGGREIAGLLLRGLA